MTSFLLHETGWDSNLIELQLAHRDTNTVMALYNRSERLDERRKMMQAWADYLDALKTGAKIIPLRLVEGQLGGLLGRVLLLPAKPDNHSCVARRPTALHLTIFGVDRGPGLKLLNPKQG